ncbi:MAG: ureidoglycolate lyase [Acidimicrobiales bacterium]
MSHYGMGTNDLRFVRAEPLSHEAFAPFGQVIARGEQVMELRDGEEFALNVLHYEHRPLRCDHLNRHHRATQALIPLGGRPALVVVAPAHLDFGRVGHVESIRAFILDGTAGINLALATWHWGPYPLMDEVDLVNVQGRGFETDNEVADLRAAFDTVVDILL